MKAFNAMFAVRWNLWRPVQTPFSMKAKALPPPASSRGSSRLPKLALLLGLLGVLGVAGGAAWWFGFLGGGAEDAQAEEARQEPTAIVQIPDVTTSIILPGRRAAFVQARARVVVASEQDAAIIRSLMPRVVDVFQTQFREMHRDELQRRHAMERLRGELLARTMVAAAPARVAEIIFDEILVQ